MRWWRRVGPELPPPPDPAPETVEVAVAARRRAAKNLRRVRRAWPDLVRIVEDARAATDVYARQMEEAFRPPPDDEQGAGEWSRQPPASR